MLIIVQSKTFFLGTVANMAGESAHASHPPRAPRYTIEYFFISFHNYWYPINHQQDRHSDSMMMLLAAAGFVPPPPLEGGQMAAATMGVFDTASLAVSNRLSNCEPSQSIGRLTLRRYHPELDVALLDPPEASRQYSSSSASWRTSMYSGGSPWVAASSSAGEWVEMDLGAAMEIAGVVVRDPVNRNAQLTSTDQVTSFIVNVSDDANAWLAVDGGAEFGRTTTVTSFASTVTTRYVRLIVTDWQGSVSMRCAALPATADSNGTGTGDGDWLLPAYLQTRTVGVATPPLTFVPTSRGEPRSYELSFGISQPPLSGGSISTARQPLGASAANVTLVMYAIPRLAFDLDNTSEPTCHAMRAGWWGSARQGDPHPTSCNGGNPCLLAQPAASETPGAQQTYGSCGTGAMAGCEALQLTPAAYGANASWDSLAFRFRVAASCTDCLLLVSIEVDTPGLEDWQEVMHDLAFTPLTVRALEYDMPPATLVSGDEHTHFTPRRMPAWTDEQAAAACPHHRADVELFDDATTWTSRGLPMPSAGANVVLPEGVAVLIRGSGGSSAEQPLSSIMVPVTSELIVDDAPLDLHVDALNVAGRFWAGAEGCPLSALVSITFHATATPRNASAKGLWAVGGQLDLHGTPRRYTWSRLAASVWPGDEHVYLQEAVGGGDGGWLPGDEIVLATSRYPDLTYPEENEVATVANVSADGHVLQLVAPLSFFHHAGTDFQMEVGLLTRNILLQGADSDGTTTFGGHMRVSGDGAAGRFSHVQFVRMGSQNVRGRYPVHFHQLDPPAPRVDPDEPHALFAGSPNITTRACGEWMCRTWSELQNSDANLEWLLGLGVDGAYLQHNSAGSASVEFAFGNVTAGEYRLQLIKPYRPDYQGYEASGPPHLVHVNASGPGMQTTMIEHDWRIYEPVDSMKRWNDIGGITVDEAGAVSVRLLVPYERMRVDIAAVRLKRLATVNYVKGCAVRDSLYRCYTVHGSHEVNVSRKCAKRSPTNARPWFAAELSLAASGLRGASSILVLAAWHST